MQTVWTQIRPDKMSGLIWIQTVLHSKGIPERIYRKIFDFEKNRQMTENMQNYSVGKELSYSNQFKGNFDSHMVNQY